MGIGLGNRKKQDLGGGTTVRGGKSTHHNCFPSAQPDPPLLPEQPFFAELSDSKGLEDRQRSLKQGGDLKRRGGSGD